MKLDKQYENLTQLEDELQDVYQNEKLIVLKYKIIKILNDFDENLIID